MSLVLRCGLGVPCPRAQTETISQITTACQLLLPCFRSKSLRLFLHPGRGACAEGGGILRWEAVSKGTPRSKQKLSTTEQPRFSCTRKGTFAASRMSNGTSAANRTQAVQRGVGDAFRYISSTTCIQGARLRSVLRVPENQVKNLVRAFLFRTRGRALERLVLFHESM